MCVFCCCQNANRNSEVNFLLMARRPKQVVFLEKMWNFPLQEPTTSPLPNTNFAVCHWLEITDHSSSKCSFPHHTFTWRHAFTRLWGRGAKYGGIVCVVVFHKDPPEPNRKTATRAEEKIPRFLGLVLLQ